MKNVGKGIVKLIIIFALIAGAVYIGKEAAPLIKLGLDLDGGVSITYQAAKDNPDAEEMGDSVYKLQLKAQDYSTEAEVYQEGGNKINIDIPGVSDANGILEELGKPGTLYFVEGNLTWPILATDSEATQESGPVVDNEAIKADTQALQKMTEMVGGNKLLFSVNKELGSVVVSIVDSATNQVIKQIPSEDMQKLKLRIRKAIGSMFDEVI